MEFYQTVMGKRFFEAQVPAIAKSLERIANAMEGNASKNNAQVNELTIFTDNAGYLYYKTSQNTIKNAISEMTLNGVNLDNFEYASAVLRDVNGKDMEKWIVEN